MPVQELENANENLRRLIESLRPGHESSEIKAQHMASVLGEVLRVGDLLRSGASSSADRRIADQLERYRDYLEELRALLPRVHAQLLTERTRLQAERVHLEAAASWAQAAGR